MKHLIHDLTTDLKFLYPCFANAEVISENELLVETETRVSKLYPAKKSVSGMKSVGEDYWGRETFVDDNGIYYCDVDGSLHFKGRDQEGEPDYRINKEIEVTYPDIDEQLSRFDEYLEKGKEYFKNHKDLELVKVEKKIKKSDYDSDQKIFCQYTVKIKAQNQ